MSSSVAVASVALGARILEKHFYFGSGYRWTGCGFSMNKEEFSEMVRCVREVEMALGKPTYELTEKVRNNRKFARSLFVAQDMYAGDTVTEENVRSVRPSDGLSPKYLPDILGKR